MGALSAFIIKAFTYDLWGNIATSTDELGFITRYSHDPLGNLTQIVRPNLNNHPSDNPVKSFIYAVAGNLGIGGRLPLSV